MAVMAQFFSRSSASTWDPQVFPQVTNQGGMARSDFDASSWDKFNSGTDKLFNLDMGSLVQPGSLPSGNSFGERFSAFAEGLKNLSDIWNSSEKNQSLDTVVTVPVYIRTEWQNGKPVPMDSMMNFKTKKRHPSWYRGSKGNGYDMFNQDIKRQMDS